VSEQPEALRLADDLDRTLCVKHGLRDRNAADELRRLHAVNAELLEALKEVAVEARHPDYDWSVALLNTVHAAIAKAKEVKP
jgi:hypothetical protein